MKSKRGLGALTVFILLVGACFGYVFLFKKHERPYREILISVASGQSVASIRALAKRYGFKVKRHKFVVGPNAFTRKHRVYSVYKYDLDPMNVNEVMSALRQMQRPGGPVSAIAPNFLVKSFAPVNDPYFHRQWNLARLQIEELWKVADGRGVTVAVIDTGVGRDLPDLDKGRFVKGFNFLARNREYDDDNGHGSHVAGTIAQDTDNGIGVAGIAPKARIMPLKVLGANGSGSTLAIAEAIVYAADNGAQIINLSLGGGAYTQILKDACDYAHSKGAIVIAAAGNDGREGSSFPGRYGTVLSVAAANQDGQLAGYSNFGEGVDIVAPGGETSGSHLGGILQNGPSFLGDRYPHETAKGGFFYYFQGTSMAAPHIAGIAALLYQRGVRTPDAMKSLLVSTAGTRLGELPVVDPLAALRQVGRAAELPSVPKSGPSPSERDIDYRLNAGAVATTAAHAGIFFGIALFLAIAFNIIRRKHRSIERLFTPLMFVGLILGSTGLSFLGFLQAEFPFTVLPERFSGLLFNSILDYDRALFFLSKPSIFWHNFLIPLGFMVLLNFRDARKRRFTIGLLLGFTAKLLCDGIFIRELTVIPDGAAASVFLIVNAAIVFLFPFVMARND